MRMMIREGDLVYLDALDRLGRDCDGIISEWKYITREMNADIVCLDNETLFDSRKFKTMGDLGKLLENQFLSMLAYVARAGKEKESAATREGIEVAKADGVKFGLPKVEINEAFVLICNEWKLGAITAAAAMKKLKETPIWAHPRGHLGGALPELGCRHVHPQARHRMFHP
jgi:DNA invertase Pin-like site-specific DNA recombinase